MKLGSTSFCVGRRGHRPAEPERRVEGARDSPADSARGRSSPSRCQHLRGGHHARSEAWARRPWKRRSSSDSSEPRPCHAPPCIGRCNPDGRKSHAWSASCSIGLYAPFRPGSPGLPDCLRGCQTENSTRCFTVHAQEAPNRYP